MHRSLWVGLRLEVRPLPLFCQSCPTCELPPQGFVVRPLTVHPDPWSSWRREGAVIKRSALHVHNLYSTRSKLCRLSHAPLPASERVWVGSGQTAWRAPARGNMSVKHGGPHRPIRHHLVCAGDGDT